MKTSNEALRQLASTLRDQSDELAQAFQRRLHGVQGYADMADHVTLDIARGDLDVMATCLEHGDDTPFLQSVETRMSEQGASGLRFEAWQEALTAFEATLTPLVSDVDAAKFVWQAMSKSRVIISRRAAEATRQAEEALQQRAAQQQDQARRLRATLEAADELIQISDLERLCRRAVELAREKLDIERCGLYLVEADGQHIVGTYGTDDHGNTTDERFSHPPIEDYEFILSLPRTELWAVHDGQHTYWDRNKQRTVGKGWSAGTVLRSATGPIGVLFNDTAISGKPIDEAQQDTLGIYCSLLGSIITRKRLEQQIAASLARRDVQVHTSTEVAQEIAAAPALEELFRRVVTLVKDRFDYYHTQIFRYDPAQDAVVLVAGYGEAGRAMLAAGHKLAMGRGVVGTAAATGVSVLATDVRQDQDWRPNPNLPDTQGELAVPITLRGYPGGKLRDQVLGILDVQSRQANALTAEDQLLLEGLCGQIAVAINNRQTQESLLREQYLMNTLMENFPAGIYFKDTRSRFIQASREVINAFGLSDPAEIVGKTDFDFFTEEHARPAYEDEQRIIRTGQPVSQEEKETRPDGRITWALVNKLPLRDQAGNTVGTFGVTLNITDRKRAEEAVRRSQTELSQALQIAKLAYWEYDVEKDLFLFNDQFYAIFHTTAEQEGGYQLPSARYSQRFVHPDDLPIVGSEIEKALKSTDRHYSRQLDHRILYADGGVGYISVSINIDRDEQGRILRYYGANQDITERKQAEATMQETLEELERLYRSTTRESWQSYRETGKLPTGYVFDRGTLQPNEDVWFPEIEQAIQKNTLVQPVTPGAPTVSPLSVHGEVIGALGVMNDPRQHLTPEETGLIASVSEQVAQALESARLFEQTQSARREAEARLREVQILQQVTQQVSGTLDMERVMDALVNTLSHEMNFSYIALNLIDQESQTMRTVRAIGLASGLNGLVRPLDQMQNDILTDVARKGKIEVIDGWDPRFDRELFEQQGHAALVRAYVPLMLRDQAVGVLEVGYRRGERPGITPEEVSLLDSLAGQAAIAIQNTQLYRQTQASLTETRTLNDIAARLNTATSLEEVLEAAAAPGIAAGASSAGIWLFEADEGGKAEALGTTALGTTALGTTALSTTWMQFAASWTREGPPPMPPGTRLRLVDFPSYQVWINESGQPTFVGDIAGDERVDPHMRAAFERTGIRAVAFMPLTLASRWIGVTIISFQAPHTFTASEHQLYRSIAAQASVAIENRRLLDQTRNALAELEATQRAYLRGQWESYLGEAARALGFVDGPTGLQADNAIWLPEMDQAIQRGETVTLAVTGDTAARAAMALPIKLRGESIGVLEFYDQDSTRTWSEDERALAQTLADQAALALENARLFEDTQARAQREQMINAITARIRASTDMEAILRTTAEELTRTLNLSSARIRLSTGEGAKQ